jgi:multidrug transporter EmrE-like cation transporter
MGMPFRSPVFWVVVTQILFTTSDLIGRSAMKTHGFKAASFFSFWFLAYWLLRQCAMFGQLYVFSTFQLGRSMALFGAASIVLSNVLGFLLLKETLSLPVYVGVSLAILAFLALALLPTKA